MYTVKSNINIYYLHLSLAMKDDPCAICCTFLASSWTSLQIHHHLHIHRYQIEMSQMNRLCAIFTMLQTVVTLFTFRGEFFISGLQSVQCFFLLRNQCFHFHETLHIVVIHQFQNCAIIDRPIAIHCTHLTGSRSRLIHDILILLETSNNVIQA